MLTDKALELFEKWYSAKTNKEYSLDYLEMVKNEFGGLIIGKLKAFYTSPLSMQWGVYQDFADSLSNSIPTFRVSICIIETQIGFGFTLNGSIVVFDKTRHQARTEAVEKLNELINSK